MTGPLERVRDQMAAAAAGWLASLTPEQRAKARYPFPADEERTTWYYTPTERGGLPLAEMGPDTTFHRLLWDDARFAKERLSRQPDSEQE